MTLRPMRTNAAYLLESAEGGGRMGFRRYAEYRDSGVEWIGEVPVGWEVEKLKFVAEVQPSNVDKKVKENEKEVLLCNYTDVYYNEEITGGLTFMKATASDLQIRKFTLKSGDIIITKDSEDPNDIAVPAYVPQDLEGIICGYHLALLRPRDRILGWYLKRVMDSRYARSFFATRANGLTRYGLGIYAINNFVLPLPPLKEQKQIAAYLDRETAKIDSLVSKKEQLIELLQEKRQAVISHAVTKGLNPNAKMKDSGVEWLGKVPAEWIVKKLKYAFLRIVGGSTPNSTEPIFWDGDVVWVTPTDVSKTTRLRDSLRRITQEGLLSCSSELVPPGSIIITSRAPVGNAALAETELCTNQGCKALIIPSSTISPIFAFHLLSILKPELQRLATGTTFTEITTNKLGAVQLPIPPLREQIAIAAFLKKETAKIDILIEKCETAIKLLKERRTALISAAVTGKIDVRSTV